MDPNERNRQELWTGWRDWSRGDLGGGGLLRPLDEHSFLELRDVGDRAEEMLRGGFPASRAAARYRRTAWKRNVPLPHAGSRTRCSSGFGTAASDHRLGTPVRV
jgi:hypothetical protein